VYGLTSLPPKRADPFRLLELIRDHWSIENRLHYRRDVALAEDACQVRKGSAPHALAALNSFVLALFDFLGVGNAKQQMRRLDAQPLFGGTLKSPGHPDTHETMVSSRRLMGLFLLTIF
jgi:hypothetical protein